MKDKTTTIIKESSDETHNQNAHAYLVQIKPHLTQSLLDLLPSLQKISTLKPTYTPTIAYGDLYSSIIADLEDKVEQLSGNELDAFDALIHAIYHNDNYILEKRGPLLHSIAATTAPRSSGTSKKIQRALTDSNTLINDISPHSLDTLFGQLSSLLTTNFKPQHHTNIPSLKHYSHKTPEEPIEYRFGTQAQRHQGQVRVSPLFIRWLRIQAKKCPTDKKINYIYFNNLGLDRSIFDIAGSKERELTLALQELANDPTLKLAVITLPAAQGLMAANDYEDTEKQFLVDDVFKEFMRVAQGKEHQSGITDFYMNKTTRAELFKNLDEKIILTNLLRDSFSQFKVKPGDLISNAQKQAIWLHFIKYELTNFIIKRVKPIGFNFTCKDAIDRGALSSAYYNLMDSISRNHPISRDEFEIALDAAAMNVKGRGMNFHRTILWNAINHYVNNNFFSSPDWLISWRDMNCPSSRINELLQIRLHQASEQFKQHHNSEASIFGLKLVAAIQQSFDEDFNDKGLLLELVSRTTELYNSHSSADIAQYRNLAKEIQIHHPSLYIIAGIMEAIIALLLYIPTLSLSQSFFSHGIATARMGFHAEQYEQLNNDFVHYSSIVVYL